MAHGRGARPRSCKQCGARRADGVQISFRALCEPCAIANMTGAMTGAVPRDAEYWAKWKAGMQRAVDSA